MQGKDKTMSMVSGIPNVTVNTSSHLCVAVYKQFGSTAFEKAILDAGFDPKDVYTIDRFGVEVLIARKGKQVYIIFRGTDSISDWLADASGELTNFITGNVHLGFARYVNVVTDTVDDWIKTHMKDGDTLTIGGHSLGGGAAKLYAYRLAKLMQVFPYVIVEGSPRVGDDLMSQEYDRLLGGRTLSIVISNDIVPHLPMKCMGYEDTGLNWLYYTQRGKAYVNNQLPRLWYMLDRLRGYIRAWTNLKLEFKAAHSREKYLTYVKRDFPV
jgi:hypothetical protein